MHDAVLIETQYLPSIPFFTSLIGKDKLILEAEEFFQKQTYRNRCHILSSQKAEVLTVPVVGANKKIKIKDMRIDPEQNWSIKHWRSIQTCYGKSPFFEFFADEFSSVYQKKYQFLWDINLDLLTICLKILKINIELTESVNFEKSLHSNIVDARSLIIPKNTDLSEPFFKAVPYNQSFGSNFEARLSVIDLLMNEGTNAKNVIQQSKVK